MSYRPLTTMKRSQSASLVIQMKNICQKKDSEASSSEEKSDGSGDNDEPPCCPTPHASLHTFSLLSDPFVDQRPGTFPILNEDFSGVHPDVPRNDMSALNCFQLFMSGEVVELLCL